MSTLSQSGTKVFVMAVSDVVTKAQDVKLTAG